VIRLSISLFIIFQLCILGDQIPARFCAFFKTRLTPFIGARLLLGEACWIGMSESYVVLKAEK
jgi:hypothetical protein